MPMIATSRGTNEDNSLKAAYIRKERFERRAFPLKSYDKRKNIAGVQLADLCAHPAARHMFMPEQPNQAYEIVKGHLYQGKGKVSGWKVSPLKKKTGRSLQSGPPTEHSQSDLTIGISNREVKQKMWL